MKLSYLQAVLQASVCISLISFSACKSRTAPSVVALGEDQFSVPHTPTGLKIELSGSGVNIEWDEVDDSSFYTIYWANSASVEKSKSKKIDRILKNSTKHSALIFGKKYYYRISATGSGGESNLSEEVIFSADLLPQEVSLVNTTPVLSSDGNKLLYLSTHCKAKLCLYLASNDNGWTSAKIETEEEIISISPDGSAPTISGDGETIFYLADSKLIIREKKSSDWSKTELVACSSCTRIAIDDTGEYVAWLDDDVLYYSAKNGADWETTTISGDASNFSLSGDGKNIVYQRGESLYMAVKQVSTWDHTAVGVGTTPTIDVSGSKVAAFNSDAVVTYIANGGGWDSLNASFAECCAFYPVLTRDGNTLFQGSLVSQFKNSSWQSAVKYSGGAFYPSVSSDGTRAAYMYDDDIYVVDISAEQTCGKASCWDEPVKILP